MSTPTTQHNNHSQVIEHIKLLTILNSVDLDHTHERTKNIFCDLIESEILTEYKLIDQKETEKILFNKFPNPELSDPKEVITFFVDFLNTNVLPLAREAILKETGFDQEPEISYRVKRKLTPEVLISYSYYRTDIYEVNNLKGGVIKDIDDYDEAMRIATEVIEELYL